jgi:RNA polymerase sigma-70 factor (ECF subfamily)
MAMHPDDHALAVRIAAGDRQAFDRFFAQTFERLYRFVLLRTQRNVDAAQDICQQVMERAVKGIATYRGEASLFTWVCQIARREVADYWERHARDRRVQVSYDQDETLRHALESLATDDGATPDRQGEQGELRLLIQTVLDHLPPPYGDALEWKYVEGAEAEAIGERLRVSTTAAHSLLARARRAFRAEFAALAQELQ